MVIMKINSHWNTLEIRELNQICKLLEQVLLSWFSHVVCVLRNSSIESKWMDFSRIYELLILYQFVKLNFNWCLCQSINSKNRHNVTWIVFFKQLRWSICQFNSHTNTLRILKARLDTIADIDFLNLVTVDYSFSGFVSVVWLCV